MPRVTTVEEVMAASRFQQEQKRAATQANLLGVPSLPGLPSSALVASAVEWLFVPTTYQPAPDEVWAVILDQMTVTEVDRKHRQLNMEGAKPQLSFYSAETPYLIVRTVG